ncbi:MAG TPA: hypothetical protein VHE30_03340 [Polyangiaceae bacterium]|nr:hypothetical protein [Polyangiaceae bacterium]
MSRPCLSPLRFLPSTLAVIALATACAERIPNAPKPVPATSLATPTKDASPHCADVGLVRACWVVPGAPGGVTVIDRPVPTPVLSKMGFRCSGNGAERTCSDRALSAEEFACDGPRCSQRHPRLPDDGEWECADVAGAVFCNGGGRAAGIAPGSSDTGFVCNARVVRGKKQPERLCADWSPDYPDGSPTGWRCKFDHVPELVRVCERDANAHVTAERCDVSHPCIEGLRCGGGRCLPPRPEPSCLLDADCGDGPCRFGACTGRTP